MDPVKPKRRYDSPRRAEQARQTRAAVVEAARRLFLRDGFAATTIAAIAAQAQVSVETIYKAFGGKPGLVRAICATARRQLVWRRVPLASAASRCALWTCGVWTR